MRRNLWWHAPPKWGPVAVFQVVVGVLLVLILMPFAVIANWNERRR